MSPISHAISGLEFYLVAVQQKPLLLWFWRALFSFAFRVAN
ncbi:hypothetical protein [Rickettsia endosymbiont of Polydrusus tereticollis]